MTIDFAVLGTAVRLESDDPEIASLVRSLWGTTAEREGEPPLSFRVVTGAGGARLEGPDGTRPLDRRRTAFHAYQLLLSGVLARISGAFVFHAGAVSRGGRALVVSGPSTFGKTTLSIRLATAGFDFMGDDLVAIERGTGRIRAASRAVRLRAGSRPLMPAAALERARALASIEPDGTWVVDPAAWLTPAGDAASVAVVAILRASGDRERTRRFPKVRIETTTGAESRLDELRALDGVTRVDLVPESPGAAVVTADRAGALDAWLRRNAESVLIAVKLASGAPSFGGVPSLRPIGTFQAALELCQEMVNRHPASRLDDEFRGREADLVTETARLLAGARCYALETGELEGSIELLRSAFDEAAGGR